MVEIASLVAAVNVEAAAAIFVGGDSDDMVADGQMGV